MSLPKQLAKHFREVHSGGNWTCSNLRETLDDITFEEASNKIGALHSIAELVYHVNYFVCAALKVLEGGELDAHDKFSFDLPILNTSEDWERIKLKVLEDAEKFAVLAEQLPEEKFGEPFTDEKYGTYYRNIHGIIEHTHYHLGQIALIKKLTRANYR